MTHLLKSWLSAHFTSVRLRAGENTPASLGWGKEPGCFSLEASSFNERFILLGSQGSLGNVVQGSILWTITYSIRKFDRQGRWGYIFYWTNFCRWETCFRATQGSSFALCALKACLSLTNRSRSDKRYNLTHLVFLMSWDQDSYNCPA